MYKVPRGAVLKCFLSQARQTFLMPQTPASKQNRRANEVKGHQKISLNLSHSSAKQPPQWVIFVQWYRNCGKLCNVNNLHSKILQQNRIHHTEWAVVRRKQRQMPLTRLFSCHTVVGDEADKFINNDGNVVTRQWLTAQVVWCFLQTKPLHVNDSA